MKHKPKGKPQERKVFLFNDILIYAKEKSSTNLIFRGCIEMHLALARESEGNSFQIKRTDKNRVYTFTCKTEYERKEWVKDMTKIIDDHTSKQDASSKKAKQLIQSNWK